MGKRTDRKQRMMRESLPWLLDEGERAFYEQQWESAMNLFMKVLKKEPENEKALERMTELLALKGDIAGLIEFYAGCARNLVASKHHSKAVEVLERILRIEPQNYLARLMIAEIHREQHDIESSFEQFARWGIIYRNNSMPGEALLFLQNALELNPARIELAGEMADIMKELKQPSHAMVLYRRLSMECLKASMTREAMTALSLSTKKAEGSQVAMMETVLSLPGGPVKGLLLATFDEAGLLKDRAEALEAEKRPEDAAALYEEIVAADPERDDIHERIGLIAVEERQYRRAVTHLLKAAEICLDRGDHARAAGLYERILRVDTTQSIALSRLKELHAHLQKKSARPPISP